MKTIETLRRERGEIVAQIKALADLEASGTTLSAEQLAQFADLEAQANQISAAIARQESTERLMAQQAVPVNANGSQAPPAIHVKQEAKQYPGAGFARMAMAVAAGKGDLQLAEKFAAKEIGDQQVAMAISTAAGSGGALIPENLHSEVIELLRPQTVVRKLGARILPLPNGNLSMARMTGGAQSSYVGEGKDSRATASQFGDVKLSAKTMITMVPISNQLIGYAGFNVEQLVLDDCISAMSVREDKAFLRDDGTNDTPTGFKPFATAAGRVKEWSGSASLTSIDEYLDGLILMLMASESKMVKPGWALSPRTWMKLFGLRDGNGNKVYPEMASGLLKGYPIAHTNTIPANLGTGANESEIYFADWRDVVIGEQDNMTMDFSTEATYVDTNGDLVSAFARNQSLIRLVGNHDVGFRHPEGLALGTKVTW
ncbi:phage major capsid protein [Aeromonas salmonicida]|uniref:phage major capsid protein n=1 Tax=Aeromonas salmonicida TaxID=645 RepID=UPI00259EA528|nr:phage major capsid protein [Aeromonas salmonicida]MDM5067303.1 phage major capsid protein [Aeromonas salmonicida]